MYETPSCLKLRFELCEKIAWLAEKSIFSKYEILLSEYNHEKEKGKHQTSVSLYLKPS